MGACCSKRKKSRKRKTEDRDGRQGHELIIGAQRNGRWVAARKKLEDDRESLEERLGFINDPFVLIPEVVMLDHLEKYLGTPEDKRNLGTASPAAEKLLKKYRVKWLLNEMLPISTFHTYLSKQDILNLRLVCPDWKCCVDNFWEALNNPVEPDYNNYKSIITSPSTISLTCCRREYTRVSKSWTPNLGDISSYEELLAVNDDTLATPAIFNPFPSKRVSFEPIYQFLGDEEDDYWRGAFDVLDRFGRELRYTKIYCCLEISTALRIVKGCLERVPYLSTFDCDRFKLFGEGRADFEDSQIPQFPPLPHLTRLTISGGCAPIYDSLLPYFTQLFSLQVQNSASFLSWYNPSTHQFPKLRHLAVTIETVGDLAKIQSLKSPLREMDIRSGLCNICPSAYFPVVEHFKETLCAVKLDLDFMCNLPLKTTEAFGLSEVSLTELPHLKTLCLNVMECGFGPVVDPLLKLSHCPEYLPIIVVNCPWRNKKLKGHKFRKNIKDMYASVIWALFPFLKWIHVREAPTTGRNNWLDTYYSRREGYDQLA